MISAPRLIRTVVRRSATGNFETPIATRQSTAGKAAYTSVAGVAASGTTARGSSAPSSK
jgi:hypothetical protein